MINKLSRVTTYVETFAIQRDSGELSKRSHATGFFVRTMDRVLLITNWHVVTGLDPSDPSMQSGPTPELLKITVIDKNDTLTVLSIPLYDLNFSPLWDEHLDRHNVDLVAVPLPSGVEEHFHFFDIVSNVDSDPIRETAGKDVFILGYPFSQSEISTSFGNESCYYLPIWKRGSIATEPRIKLSNRLVLIDSMSRPGMSGSPVVMAEDVDVMKSNCEDDAELIRRINEGDITALSELNLSKMKNEKVKRFNVLGVYSGVIGTTKLQEVALGKCWHISVLHELITNHQPGHMPYHAPSSPHPYYEQFFRNLLGVMVRTNSDGDEVDRISLTSS